MVLVNVSPLLSARDALLEQVSLKKREREQRKETKAHIFLGGAGVLQRDQSWQDSSFSARGLDAEQDTERMPSSLPPAPVSSPSLFFWL